jgi:cyclopropane fatty-acyl-phospholipid synthase-like methyltransferase
MTGVPIVLNTSFNDSEPIVCSPDDAIDTFLKTRIDYLAIGDFLVAKRDNAEHQPKLQVANLAWDRLCPEADSALDEMLPGKRLSRMDDIIVVTDREDYTAFDQVLPLYAEQQFFIDEIPRERMAGARALEIGVGSGILSIAAMRAGAKSVVGLEINPRAMELAEFNLRLNQCEHAVEIRAGDDDVYKPVAGKEFDYILSNPPFVPVPADVQWHRHSDAGPLGMDIVEKIFAGLDAHLAPDGFAQFVVVCLGTSHEPQPLCEMAAQLLRGNVAVHVNPVPARYVDWIAWLTSSGSINRVQARGLAKAALEKHCTHMHLCTVHYEKSGPREVKVTRSRKVYKDWNSPLTAVEL